ncbi:hypothetical protein BN1051_01633 [Arthrobacter saudimassiliensis]|uniref:Uncharacterized protein n=1 Tax=Arthrobacter saudimassiliensis TaxID=1461584 RepID=A0A078MLX8_9MICC|nr:hypothetical protein BN1051_01633 [Arthrobacter saudimassiliensis]
MRTLRGFGRLLTELPQPARGGLQLGYLLFLAGLPFGIASGQLHFASLGAAASGVCFAVAGWCVFRNVRGAAAVWSAVYRESKGIPWDGFTNADMPTVRTLGFFYLLVGVWFTIGGVVGFLHG